MPLTVRDAYDQRLRRLLAPFLDYQVDTFLVENDGAGGLEDGTASLPSRC